MSTLTARAGLIKPAGTDNVDVSQLNSNADTIDANLGAYTCTSATRPSGAARYTGQIIRETDSGWVYIWDGAAWVAISYTPAGATGAWTTYAPTWTGTTNPAIGNGSIAGKYVILGTKTVSFRVKITAGTTTTQGTGNQNVGLPFTSVTADSVFSTILHFGGGYYAGAVAQVVSSVSTGGFYVALPAAGQFMNNGAGLNVGTTGFLVVSGTYEAL
jgi:hypothetical protein